MKMSRRGINVDLDERKYSNPELADYDEMLPTLAKGKKKNSLISRSNTKEFKGLVAMINYSSKTRGKEGTEDVLKRWNAMSRI